MTMPFDARSEISDDALIALYGNGDREAAEMLTLRHGPRVFAYARRVLADQAEAEDVAQEAMLRLWHIAPDWRPGEAKVSTWLYRVTTNLCTDRLRRRGRQLALEAAGDPADGRPGAEEALLDEARSAALSGALGQLPDRQRQAVVLRHIEGLGNPEIAKIMDLSVEAVESLTARGKRALRAALAGRRAELGYDDDR